jgi:hypothetical protein
VTLDPKVSRELAHIKQQRLGREGCGRVGRLLLTFLLTVPSGSLRTIVGGVACSDHPPGPV